jgi:hypothetical protein
VQRHFVLVSLPFLLTGLLGCGAASESPASRELGQGLQVSPNGTVDTATYAISGPNDFASAGTVPVGSSPEVPVVVSHLPVGVGYELELNATASDGIVTCQGSATFDVADSSATLTLVVHLECAVASGDLDAEATLNACPVIDGLSANPVAVVLGGVSSLSVAAHDSDNGPSPLAYSWTVNGVKLPKQKASTLSFACSSAGQVTIAAGVSDGDPDPSCADAMSITVSCE